MKRILGIDYGTKRIGIAVTDALGITVQPLTVMERKSAAEDIRRINEIISEKQVGTIVVGMPSNMNGTPGRLSDEIKWYAGKLKEGTGLPVEFVEERLTTFSAERMLTEEADMPRSKRKKVRDKIAAVFILQNYMDTKR
ncbi:MAG: Holliday junction resolvase RuvX [Elusimicrobiota bacterium]